MPPKRREALSKFFMDISKVIFAIGVIPYTLEIQKFDPIKIGVGLLGIVLFVIMGYKLQPKE